MTKHEEISKLNLKLEFAEQLRITGSQTFSIEESKSRIKEVLQKIPLRGRRGGLRSKTG